MPLVRSRRECPNEFCDIAPLCRKGCRLVASAALDAAALQAAKQIEGVFGEVHLGGPTQRLAKVQVIVRDAMKVAR